MKWMEITVLTSHEAKEAATEVLYRAGASGVVVEDAVSPVVIDDVEDYAPPETEVIIPLEEVRLIAYLPLSESLVTIIESIRVEIAALWEFGLDPGKAEVNLVEIEEEDWSTAWKQFYKPLKIGEKLLIKPTWETVEGFEGRVVVELDPGMAFGTGTHATTVMCLEYLETLHLTGKRVLDLGCGSGILSIAAAQLGADEVLALDYDPVAVKVAEDNVQQNGVSGRVKVLESNLFSSAEGTYDLIVANIIARIIVEALPSALKHLSPGGMFLASGIIKDKLGMVKEQLEQVGMSLVEVRESGEWVSLLAAPASPSEA